MDETQKKILELTIINLEKTFTSADKKERQDAENTLRTLEQELFLHCKNILYLIQENNIIKS